MYWTSYSLHWLCYITPNPKNKALDNMAPPSLSILYQEIFSSSAFPTQGLATLQAFCWTIGGADGELVTAVSCKDNRRVIWSKVPSSLNLLPSSYPTQRARKVHFRFQLEVCIKWLSSVGKQLLAGMHFLEHHSNSRSTWLGHDS
jgi:hypothetical protein